MSSRKFVSWNLMALNISEPAITGLFNWRFISDAVQLWSLQAPREIQFFPCTISRADDASGASLDSLPYETRSVERSIEDQGEDPDCQILECLPTRGSTESDISWEPGQGMQNALTLANGVGATYNEQMVDDPPAKRQRKMTIRHAPYKKQFSLDPTWVSQTVSRKRFGFEVLGTHQ